MIGARRLISVVLRFGLGGLMLVAGAMKMRAPAAFATEISNYQLFTHAPGLPPALAPTLPMIEILLGLALVGAPWIWRRAATVGVLVLLVGFSVAVGSAYFRNLNIECGCFGTGSAPITVLTLVRNVLLTAGAGVLLWVERTPPTGRAGPITAPT